MPIAMLHQILSAPVNWQKEFLNSSGQITCLVCRSVQLQVCCVFFIYANVLLSYLRSGDV